MMTNSRKRTGGFYRWMMENYLHQQNRYADLARDMQNDYTFPAEDDFDVIMDYLVYDCGAVSAGSLFHPVQQEFLTASY